MNEIMERPSVRPVDAYKDGSCQGCRVKHGKVYEINCNNWITRLCLECLKHVYMQARQL